MTYKEPEGVEVAISVLSGCELPNKSGVLQIKPNDATKRFLGWYKKDLEKEKTEKESEKEEPEMKESEKEEAEKEEPEKEEPEKEEAEKKETV